MISADPPTDGSPRGMTASSSTYSRQPRTRSLANNGRPSRGSCRSAPATNLLSADAAADALAARGWRARRLAYRCTSRSRLAGRSDREVCSHPVPLLVVIQRVLAR